MYCIIILFIVSCYTKYIFTLVGIGDLTVIVEVLSWYVVKQRLHWAVTRVYILISEGTSTITLPTHNIAVSSFTVFYYTFLSVTLECTLCTFSSLYHLAFF